MAMSSERKVGGMLFLTKNLQTSNCNSRKDLLTQLSSCTQLSHVMLQAGMVTSGKGTGGDGQHSAEHAPVVCPGGQGAQQHPGLYQKQPSEQEHGGDLPFVFSSGEATY